MTLIVSDTMTAAAGTDLTAHTPEIGAKPVAHPSYGQALKISSAGRIYAPSTTASALDYYPTLPGSADIDVEATITELSDVANFIGAGARISSVANTLYYASYAQSTHAWALNKIVAGVNTALGSSAAALTIGQAYDMLFVCRNAGKAVLIDGVSKITSSDNAITAIGYVGIRNGLSSANADATGYQLDNLNATDTVAAAAAATGSGWRAIERRHRRELLTLLTMHKIRRGD